MKIVISSGHGLHVRGASGILDEVDEARRVVEQTAAYMREAGHEVIEFHDDTSTTQNENLETIVEFHNMNERDLDISVHFNAYIPTGGPMGTEVLYITQHELATKVAEAISEAGDLIDRGSKKRTDLYFLNNTEKPAILLEICFVDSAEDAENYTANFASICRAIASVGDDSEDIQPDGLSEWTGKCSWFGGPDDTGVDPSEGLAFIYEYDQAPHLFLKEQPFGTTGLARRLNPAVYYVACRWDYDVTSKTMLANKNTMALVKAGDREYLAWPADWGPHEDTDRVADLSPGLIDALQITTDDVVTVMYPAPDWE